MSLGKAFQIVEDSQEIKNGNFIFWVNPQNVQETLKSSHFVPSQSKFDFWQTYLKESFMNPNVIKTHIYYKNTPKDEEYLSGITLDSDIYIRIDEKDYILQFTKCNKHTEFNDNCQDCIKEQLKTKQTLQKIPQDQLTQMFRDCITKNPFIPYESDIQFIDTLCEELFCFIDAHFDMNYTELFIKDYAKEHIILCRDNISLLKEIKSHNGGNYYRYGFHIYFFNIKLDEEGKRYIKNHFSVSKNIHKTLNEFYPTTRESEVFDRAPLTGTTALPLSATSDKIYNYYYNDGMHLIKDNQEIQEALNPFGGQLIKLKPQFMQQSIYELNLIQMLEKNKINSYSDSIIYTISQLKQFKEDFQFMILLKSYKHPPYSLRNQIISDLYSFLFDEKRVQQSLLVIQKCYYLIMCENVEDIIQQEIRVQQPDWMTVGTNNGKKNSEKNRYPLKIVEVVQRYHDDPKKKITDKSIAYKRLFDIYNKYKQENNLETEVIQFDAIVQISYRNFKNFVNLYENGIYAQMFPIILNKKKCQNTIYDILFQYVYSQLDCNIVVSNQQFYYFDTENSIYDYNKYHLIQEGEVEGKVVSILNKLKQGISCQIKVMSQDFGKYCLFKDFYNKNIKQKQDFMDENEDNDELIEYINQMCLYMDLQDLVCGCSCKAKQKSIVKEIIIEKLARQGQHQQMDKQQNCFGVFNGVMEFEPNTRTFQLHQGDSAKQFFVSKSTMFNVRSEFIDENSKLLTPDKLPQDLKVIYDYIDGIYNTIYRKGKDIEVFYWLLDKNIPGEKLLISFGTGSDGKTTAKQAMCFALGQGQQNLNYGKITRKLVTKGYTAQVVSTILQAKQGKPNEHGTGGFIELQDCYFALMSELASEDPLVSSAIKSMLCGTQLASRKAYAKDIETFQNTCFLELQTNNYPGFDQVLDDGLKRRVLFYQHDVKFVPKAIYETLDVQRRQSCAIADESIRNKLNSDPDYVDVLGFYLLNVFSQCIYRQDYIPKILLDQSSKFFDSSLSHMKPCINMLKKDENGIIIFSHYEEQIRQIISDGSSKRKKNFELEKIQENHLKTIKDHFMQQFITFNLLTKQQRCLSLNEFQQIQTDQNYIIFLKGYSYIDDGLYQDNEKLLNQIM